MPSTSDYLDSLVARGIVGGDALERTMTHWPEEPNPAQPYLDKAAQYARTGLGFATGGLQGAGAPMPDWMRSNPVQRALQNPDNVAAMGMARPSFDQLFPAKAAEVDRLIADGHTVESAADASGVPGSTIQRYLKRTGQKTAATENPVWPPEREASLIADYNKGMSQIALAKKYDSTPGSIWAKLTRLGNAGKLNYVKRPPSFAESPDWQAKFIKDVQAPENWSQTELGRMHGVDPRTTGKWISWLQEQGKLKGYAPKWQNFSADPYNYSMRGNSPADPLWEKARQIAGQSGEAPGTVFLRLKGRQGAAGPAPDEAASQDWATALRAFQGR